MAYPVPTERPATGMTARTRTLLVTSVIGVVLFVVALTQQVDYVALGPGEADNTLGYKNGTQIIQIAGAAQETGSKDARGRVSYPGQLLLTTVSVGPKLTMAGAIEKWVDRDYSVVPNEVVNPPSQTQQQTDKQNAQDMTNSQDDATTAALDLLGKPEIIAVGSVEMGSNAAKALRVKDVITAIDGQPVTGYAALRQALATAKAGDIATVAVLRDGSPLTVMFPLIDGGGGRAILGIIPSTTSTIKVTITNQNVGGPSAGMMYALGIINKLSAPADQLTGNRIIAGTGTIDPLGNVGDIGGIQEKLRGAKAAGATVFLVPHGNCAEAARAHVGGLRLIDIPDVPPTSLTAPSNLKTAYTDLKELAAGNGAQLKSC